MLDVPVTYQNGVFVPKKPVDLPQGSEGFVHMKSTQVKPEVERADASFHMMREEDWPTTPEGIAALLERWKDHQPPIYLPGEEAELKAWRAEMKRFNIEAVRKQMGLPE